MSGKQNTGDSYNIYEMDIAEEKVPFPYCNFSNLCGKIYGWNFFSQTELLGLNLSKITFLLQFCIVKKKMFQFSI